MTASESKSKKSTPTLGLRERNRLDKIERLKRAAQHLFARKGFHETTIREIAERAGVGTGTVFLYVKDKASLLEFLFRDAVAAVQDEAFSTLPPDGTLLDQSIHVLSRFYDYYGRDRALSRLFVKELLFTDQQPGDEHFALTFSFIARLAGLVDAARQRGELRESAPAQQVALGFFAAYFLVLVGFLDPVHGAAMSPELATQTLRGALDLQLRGVAAEQAAAQVVAAPKKRTRSRRRVAAGRSAKGARTKK
ncbi:MAG TPA: TetR/AcrR family transcriptional regulator [Pseudomonadota bacterium]|jgi:AcrR family transcriptional regulator|nr:TetR/AcrR family transcriptional regulator [Pseudomonadota bacterium]